MKIFQLIDMIIRLFRLNKKPKVVLLFLIPTALFGQATEAFFVGKRYVEQQQGITVDFLVVAGGGSTALASGGAGAGGYRSSYGSVTGGGLPAENPVVANIGDVFTVTVGLGAPANQSGNTPAPGGNSIFSTITSLGGGSSYGDGGTGRPGGSGAGVRYASGTSFIGGLGTVGQGFNGGSNATSVNFGGGGGGGSGQTGGNGTSTTGGKGGDGVQNSITGTAIYYAGGGGAGTLQGGTAGLGGLGGGGNAGAAGGNNAGSPGVDGLGGGAGGGSYQTGYGSGAKGGNGVVIIRFDDAYDVITTSGNLVLEKSIVASDRVVKFTSGSGTIEFVEGSCDEYFYSNSLLLHMDGANNSTTFTDNSINNFTPTVFGNAKISTAQSVFGESSLLLDGSGDYLSYASNANFDYGTDDFTIEGWFRSTNVSLLQTIFGQIQGNPALSGIVIRLFNSKIAFVPYTPEGNPAFVLGDISTISSNTWYHFAVTKSGTTYKMFLNGILEDTHVATLTPVWNGKSPKIGTWQDFSGRDFSGHIDDFRITKGVARYTSNFTPPAAPFEDNSCNDFWDGTQTGILDDYPTAAAAYSVRALNSAYTEPLMTIRRASDNKETNVYALASGDLDVALINSFCSGTSCTVRTWYDQSGNGRDAVQTTVANQPLIYASGSVVLENGKPAIRWQNYTNAYFLKQTTISLSHPITFFATVYYNGTSGRQDYIFDSNSISARTGLIHESETNKFAIYAGSTSLTPYLLEPNVDLAARQLLFTILFNASNSQIYKNNVNTVNGGPAIVHNSMNGLTIGNFFNSSSTFNWSGSIQELIIYGSNKTQSLIENNINSYFSIY